MKQKDGVLDTIIFYLSFFLSLYKLHRFSSIGFPTTGGLLPYFWVDKAYEGANKLNQFRFRLDAKVNVLETFILETNFYDPSYSLIAT